MTEPLEAGREPLSDEELREIRERHVPEQADSRGERCAWCSDLVNVWWPCDAARLLTKIGAA